MDSKVSNMRVGVGLLVQVRGAKFILASSTLSGQGKLVDAEHFVIPKGFSFLIYFYQQI
jgi:hypothetical protein